MMIVNDNEKLGRKMFPLSSEFFMSSMQNKIIIYQKLIYAKHKKIISRVNERGNMMMRFVKSINATIHFILYNKFHQIRT